MNHSHKPALAAAIKARGLALLDFKLKPSPALESAFWLRHLAVISLGNLVKAEAAK